MMLIVHLVCYHSLSMSCKPLLLGSRDRLLEVCTSKVPHYMPILGKILPWQAPTSKGGCTNVRVDGGSLSWTFCF